MYTKVCSICGKEFETNKPNKVMCCSPHPKKCLQCGSTFYVTIYNKDKKFCNTHTVQVNTESNRVTDVCMQPKLRKREKRDMELRLFALLRSSVLA